jgi:hypothetical protein
MKLGIEFSMTLGQRRALTTAVAFLLLRQDPNSQARAELGQQQAIDRRNRARRRWTGLHSSSTDEIDSKS